MNAPAQSRPSPAEVVDARNALHALAAYVVAPALLDAIGRIRLSVLPGGFGTPALAGPVGRVRIVVDDDARVLVGSGVAERSAILTDSGDTTITLSSVAASVGLTARADDRIGHDLPPFDPEAPLAVTVPALAETTNAFEQGEAVLAPLRWRLAERGTVSDLVLWPEHFDLGFSLETAGNSATIGCSPGDAEIPEPYFYVAPWDRSIVDRRDPWNASFGAALPHASVTSASDAGHWCDRVLAALDI